MRRCEVAPPSSMWMSWTAILCPNITIGPPVVASLRKAVDVPLDCHLMIENPDQYIPAFADAGANWISVHQEVCRHLNRTLELIRSHGMQVGVVINPATPVQTLGEVLDIVDYVLVMSVNPGFGGQKFIPGALEKVRKLATMRAAKGVNFRIEIDGGVDLATIGTVGPRRSGDFRCRQSRVRPRRSGPEGGGVAESGPGSHPVARLVVERSISQRCLGCFVASS